MATLSMNKNFENNENVTTEKNLPQAKTSAERKSLKTLQVGSDGKITGFENKKLPLKKFPVLKKPVKVFIDKKRTWLEMGTQTDSASLEEREAQTVLTGDMRASTNDVHNDSGVGAGDIDEEAYNLMVKEPIPEQYWRDIAEERRCSLAEALSENEMLHQSMEELKEENQNLSLLASQAEYLASVLNDVLGEKTEGDKNKDTGAENKDNNSEIQTEGDNNRDTGAENKDNNSEIHKEYDNPEQETVVKDESKAKEITETDNEKEK